MKQYPISVGVKTAFLEANDNWHACSRCGTDKGDSDLWHPLCPRCQQLAALEAEIGRAVIGAGVIFHSINPAIDALIARYRALLAAGAEAATGGEEAR